MDSRLSISNVLFPISFDQFKSMVVEFKAFVEASFGTSCRLEIRAMHRIKMTSSFMHDESVMDFMHQFNQKATFFEGSDVHLMPSEAFALAVYIEVSVRPENPSAAPKCAFGHLEFKGSRPRQATYYIQPDDPVVISSLKRAHRFQKIGDGYSHNTD